MQEEECGYGEPYLPMSVDVLFGDPTVALRGPWGADDLIQMAPTAGDLSEDRVSDVTLGGDTGQAVMVERSASVRGLMTPLHVRDEAETYRILEGSVTFFIGSEAVLARASEVVIVPAEQARTLRVD